MWRFLVVFFDFQKFARFFPHVFGFHCLFFSFLGGFYFFLIAGNARLCLWHPGPERSGVGTGVPVTCRRVLAVVLPQAGAAEAHRLPRLCSARLIVIPSVAFNGAHLHGCSCADEMRLGLLF